MTVCVCLYMCIATTYFCTSKYVLLNHKHIDKDFSVLILILFIIHDKR